MEKEAVLTISQFLAIMVPLLGGIIIVAYVLFDRTNTLKTIVENQGESLKDAKIDIGALQAEQKELLAKRNQDLLEFTRVLGKINITLGGFDITLKTVESAVREMKDVFKDKRLNQ